MNCEADIVWTTLHGNPLNCCGDISTLKITDVNLRVALQEEDHHVSRIHPLSTMNF